MTVSDAELKSLLISSRALTEKEWSDVAEEAHRKKRTMPDMLVERGAISDRELGTLMADAIGYPPIYLTEAAIPEHILKIIPEPMSRAQRVIAFSRGRGGINIAMTDPTDLETVRYLEKRTGERILPHFATERDIENALSRYHQFSSSFTQTLNHLIASALSSTDASGEESIIPLVDHILQYGVESRASDIHAEPQQKKIVVRLRIDGILHDICEIPPAIHERVVSRIKVLGRMRLDEHHSAQDGRFRITVNELPVDVRVSIVPTTKGEKIVLRLLSDQTRRFLLEDLGFSEDDFERVRRNLAQPWGMILSTGPTGCGKTTTLYAMLKILNTRAVNISTIEDPVEYDIEGVNQIQVNPKTNLTFASGLRAIVRQNPDIIMVGEIRDGETAGIAVNAAMTGHLVLSTLHTNDAATSLPRLIDMGIEPFLIASTTNLIVAQRLVRRNCMHCIESYTIPIEQFKSEHPKLAKRIFTMYPGKRGVIQFYRGKGCPACDGTAFAGRTGIFEVLEINDAVKDLIRTRADADRIRECAHSAGMATLIEDGIKKMITGVTTLEEVLRVTREEEA